MSDFTHLTPVVVLNIVENIYTQENKWKTYSVFKNLRNKNGPYLREFARYETRDWWSRTHVASSPTLILTSHTRKNHPQVEIFIIFDDISRILCEIHEILWNLVIFYDFLWNLVKSSEIHLKFKKTLENHQKYIKKL